MASLFSRIRDGLAKTAQQIRERLSVVESTPTSGAASRPLVAGEQGGGLRHHDPLHQLPRFLARSSRAEIDRL